VGERQLCTTNADCTGGDICSRATATCGPAPTPLPGRDAGTGFPPPRDGGTRFPPGDAGH
jgi:hypothetical protein